MDTYSQAFQHALIDLIKTRGQGTHKIGRGVVEVKLTVTSPISEQWTAKHYNEIGKYSTLQFIERRNGKFCNYQERFK